MKKYKMCHFGSLGQNVLIMTIFETLLIGAYSITELMKKAKIIINAFITKNSKTRNEKKDCLLYVILPKQA